MTQIDIAALVADREAGTKGPLVVSDFCAEGSHMTAVAFPDRFGVPGDTVAEFFSNWRDASRKEYRISWAQAEANARRFARLDELETGYIAQDAELKQLQAELARLRASQADAGARVLAVVRQAHETLVEINPNNYTHDEVVEANDAAVESIFLLADLIGETHGKSSEWWKQRRAALAEQERADG